MTYLQANFQLNWLNISQDDGGGKYTSSPWNGGLPDRPLSPPLEKV